MASSKGSAVQATEGRVIAPKAFDRYRDALITEAGLTESDFNGQEISETIGEKILLADSLEAAIEAQEEGGLSGQDLAGVEHEVLSFDMKRSTKPDAARPVYFQVRAVALEDKPKLGLTTGEEFSYNVGAGNVVDVLYKARSTDRLPLGIILVEKATSNGTNTVLLVKLIPNRSR